MLKNKLKTILIVTLLLMFIISPFVHADEENISMINNEDSVINQNQLEEENYKNSDVYLTGDDVTIDYTVVGNAFIFADNVTISAPIGGDAFICAKNIKIDTNGYIYSNLFACSENLVINGIVYDLYAACKNITIAENGYIYRDIRSGSSNIDIFGTIGRNAYIGCDKISLSSAEVTTGYNIENLGDLKAKIYGNIEYRSSNEISIPDDSVEGEVKFTPFSNTTKLDITDTLLSVIETIVFAVVIWFVLNWLAPKFTEKSKELLTNKIGAVIGFGLLGLIVIPIISLILIFIPVTISLSFLLLGIYAILLVLASTIFVITLSEFIADKLNLTNKWLHLAVVSVVALIVYLAKMIPYLGGVISLICIILGLGILVKNILPNSQSDEIKF